MCAGSAELRLTLPHGAAARPRFWGEWEVAPKHVLRRLLTSARRQERVVSGARFEPLTSW